MGNQGSLRDNAMLYLLDRSGSMSTAVDDLVKAINAAIENNRRDPLAKTTDCNIVTFDSLGFDRIRAGETMAELRPITRQEVEPRAMTPLNDAIGYCIDPILAQPQSGRKVLVIFTDGLENNSKKYRDVERLRSRIQEFERRGNLVIFLAANLDAQKVGVELGVPAERSINTRANGQPGTGSGLMYALLAATGIGLAYWALAPSAAEAASLGFSDNDRKGSMGGFDDWQGEVDKDIAGFDPGTESIMNLSPEVVDQAQNLPEDFDPAKGSLDNPDSENYAEAQEASGEESSDSGDQDSSEGGGADPDSGSGGGDSLSSDSDWGSDVSSGDVGGGFDLGGLDL